ncbi:hypothetical protein [Trueperella abortisuis]|nr:hypothetical protein [Trueperella abortisuis]
MNLPIATLATLLSMSIVFSGSIPPSEDTGSDHPPYSHLLLSTPITLSTPDLDQRPEIVPFANQQTTEGGGNGMRYLVFGIAQTGVKRYTHVNLNLFTKKVNSFPGGKAKVTWVDPKSKWGLQKDFDSHSGSRYKVISPRGDTIGSLASDGRIIKVMQGKHRVWPSQ